MKVFKTYKEAVISNGSTKGVYHNEMTSEFCHLTAADPGINAPWVECNPADYLETLTAFNARGLKLTKGDKYTGRLGNVIDVGTANLPSANAPLLGDEKRFVVKAAAYDTETPEEKEAFDRLAREHDNETNQDYEMGIDTTPQQYESLSSSEKPNSSWWDGGGVAPDDGDCVYTELRYIGDRIHNISCSIMDEDLQQTLGDISSKLWGVETPAEREERERLEAAYDLYCDFTNSNVVDATCMSSYDFERSLVLTKWLTIVDKTGYRKKEG